MTIRPIYYFLKLYVPLSFRFYFRKIRIKGRENVPSQGPVIFAPNHQNAFFDALVIGAETSLNPWFLTRASIFGSSFVRALLTSMGMLPIYRIRDGLTNVRKNDAVIEKCSALLRKKHSLLIFPAGRFLSFSSMEQVAKPALPA